MATHGMCGHSKWHMFILPKVSYATIVAICSQGRLDITDMNEIAYRIIFLIVFPSLQLILSILQTFQTLLRPPRNWTASAPSFSRRISCRSSSKLFSKDALNKALPFLSAKQWHWNISYMKVLLLRWWIIRRVVYYSKNLQNMYSSILWNISPLFLKNRFLRTNQLITKITNLDQW